MSAIDSVGNQSFPHDRASIVSEAIESFVSATTEALADCGASEETLNSVEEQGETVASVVGETIQEQSKRLEESVTIDWDSNDHTELSVTSTTGATFPLGKSISSKVSETDLQSELDGVEERLSGHEPHTSDGEDTTPDGSVTPETPLEQTVGLPQELIDEESANVQRAVFVASDIEDYTTSVPAGRAITSSELRRVLKAGTDCNGHSQTVDRVIQVLDGMAQDSVKVVERRGERRVVFDESLCHRLKELSHGDSDGNHSVVIGETV